MADAIPAISGIEDATQARVVLFQSGKQVHAPLTELPLQPLDATLTAIAALSGAADRGIYFTGADVAALFDLTAFARTLLDDADAAAARTTLGVSWELISSQTPAAVASVSWTGLSAYRKLRITGFLRPATDAVSLFLRSSTNNGSSYDSGASDYYWQVNFGSNATPTAGRDTADTGLILGNASVGNAAEEGIQFTTVIDNFNQSLGMWAHTVFTSADDAGALLNGTTGGKRVATTARNALQLIFSSGNISIGHVTLEGIRS